jgi:hypothetical protein
MSEDLKQQIIKRGKEYNGGKDKKWRACSISFDLALLAISVDIDEIYQLLEAEGL